MSYKLYKVFPVKIRWVISYLFANKFLVGIIAFGVIIAKKGRQ